MKYTVSHPDISENSLTFDLEGFFSSPKFKFNDEPIKIKKRKLFVKDKSGADLEVGVKMGFPDSLPKFLINGDQVLVAPPFKWYELTWILLPLGLLAVGGAIGGGIGGFTTVINARVFRSDAGTVSKYVFTGLLGIAAVVIAIFLATFVQVAFNLGQ